MSADHPVLAGLTPPQIEAVIHDGPILVLAGAGTGKTRTLTAAVAWRIAEQGIPPHRVLSWKTRHLWAAFAPGRFHFYQHTCAVPSLPEGFDQVLLRFEEGKFTDPKWVGFKVVPEAIQQARNERARDTSRTAQTLQLT